MVKCVSRRWRQVCGCVLVGLVAGCGGSSHSNTRGGGGSPKALPGSARFHVDVVSGQVNVETLASSDSRRAGRAILLGDAVRLGSSDLLSTPGNTGIRTLRVALTNLWPQRIGVMPNGTESAIRVLFSPFVASATFSDLRPKVTVSTVAGSPGGAEGDGPVGNVAFGPLFGAAVASDGTVFVTEFGRNRVRQIRAGFVSTLAGRTTAGSDDGLGTGATLNVPLGVAIHPLDGALIVTEFTGQRIRRISRDGVVTRIAGTTATEAGDTNGNGNAARFRNPAGVAVDRDGTIYVAEFGGHRLRKLVLTGADPTLAANYQVSVLAGSGVAGLADKVGAAAQFNQPSALALDDASHLFVADRANGRVRVVTRDGAVSTIATTFPAFSTTDGSSNTVSTGEGLPFDPKGLAWVQGALAVATTNQVVSLRLRATGAAFGSASSWVAQALAGRGTSVPAGTAEINGDGFLSTFAAAGYLAAEPNGGLLVVDDKLLRRVTPVNGLFPVGTTGSNAASGNVRLANPTGLIPSSVFGKNLPFVAYPGKLDAGASSEAQDWQFILPAGVSAFEFMVTVEANTPSLTTPEAVTAGTVVHGSPAVRVRTLAGAEQADLDGPPASARFNSLRHVATDAAGVIYLTDPLGRVRRLGPEGLVTTIAGRNATGQVDGTGDVARFGQPNGIVAAPDGRTLFVSDFSAHRVRRLAFTGGDATAARNWRVSTVAGTGAAGAADGTGDVATFNQLAGLARDGGGNLFVAESGGKRIRLIRFLGGDPESPAAYRVDLVAGDKSAAAGQAAVVDGTGGAARFVALEAVAAAPDGSLYVADGTRIRKITTPAAAGGGVVTSPVGSTIGYVDSPQGADALLGAITAIALDSSGYLFACDRTSHTIRRISPDGAVTTVAGTGVPGAVDGTGDTATFVLPSGICVDPAGNLVVTDATRVRLVQRTLGASSP